MADAPLAPPGTPAPPEMGLQEIMTEMQQLMEMRNRLPPDAKEQGAIMLRLRQLEEMMRRGGVPGGPEPAGLESGNSVREQPKLPFAPQPGLPGVAPPNTPAVGGPGFRGVAPPARPSVRGVAPRWDDLFQGGPR